MHDGSHSLHTLGTADTTADATPSVRANVTNAEATAVVERLLGMRIAQINGPRNTVVQRIEDRVFNIVEEARASISRADLRTALDANLNNALQQIRPELNYDNANVREKTQAIAQAVYESVPSDIIYQMGITSAPVNIAVNDGQPTSVVEIPVTINGAATVVRIDSNHPFWRRNTFRNQSDMQSAMAGLTGREIGIQNPNLRNYALGTGDIRRLTNAQFDLVSVPSVNIADTAAVVLQAGTTTTNTNLTVRMNLLLKGLTTDDAPAGLQNRYIAELNPAQIQTLLLHRGQTGNFPYWRQFVSCGTNLPTDIVNVCVGRPGYVTWILANAVQAEIIAAGYAPAARVGARQPQIRLLDMHGDVRAEQAKMQALMERLTTGSENPGGAALALNLAASNRNVMAAATQQTEETKLRTDLNKDRAKLELSVQLKKLGELKTNFRIPTMPGGAAANYELIFNERAALNRDIGAIGSPAPWTSEFCLHGGFPAPSTFVSAADRRDMSTRLQTQLKEVTEELNRYEEVSNILRRLAQSAVTGDVYTSSTALSTRVSNAGVVTRTAIGADFNNVAVAELISTETKLQSVADIEASIKKNEDSLKKVTAGGENGDSLQQKIFEEHFKRQGLSSAEAKKSANYLYTRSLLDDELTTQHQVLIDDLFEAIDHGPENRGIERKGRGAIAQIATTLGVPIANRVTTAQRTRGFGFGTTTTQTFNVNAPYRDWERVPYRTLVTAYFAHKKVYEGGAPQTINAAGSHAVQNEMKRIAEVMSRRHTTMILNDMGNDLPDEDRRKIGSRKALSAETLEQFLTGEAPDKYAPRITAVLSSSEARAYREDRVRRGLRNVGSIAAMPLSAIAGGAVAAIKNTPAALSSAKNWTWAQRKNIATFALFTALGGPLGMAAWGGMKAMEGGNAPAAHSGH